MIREGIDAIKKGDGVVMTTIAVNNEVITVIVIFSVESERQQELIDAIAEFVETVEQQLRQLF